MRSFTGNRRRGATLLELVLVIGLIVFFIGLTAMRVWEVRKMAERTGVEQLVGSIRSALGLHMAKAVVSENSTEALRRLDGINPIDLIEQPPQYYVGELKGVDPGKIKGYRWYFDVDQRMLVYRVGNPDILETKLEGPARVRFQIVLDYEDRNGNQRFDSEEVMNSLILRPVEPFTWRVE